MKTHYLYFVSGVEILADLMLLSNQYVPLALVLLGATLANILTFHITMMPQGLPLPIVVTILWCIVAWSVRVHLAAIFVHKA
ncbi:MAG: hypothetical protein ACYDA5_11765 [Vulcanimicrobiaceae bacterium]